MLLEKDRFKSKYILILLFPILFDNISFNNGQTIIHFYSYILLLLFSAIYFLLNNKVNLNLFLYGLFFSSVAYFYSYGSDSNFLLISKYLIMLTPAFFIPNFLSMSSFSKNFIKLIIIFLMVSIVLYFFNIGVNYSYGGYKRLYGFLSEPSAMALPVSVLLLYSVYTKNKLLLILSIIALLLTKSPTVLVVSITTLLLYYIIQMRNKLFQIILLVLSFSIAFNIVDILYFFISIFELHVFERLVHGIVNITSLGEAGYNPRFSIFQEFIENYISLFGYGLNTYEGISRVWMLHMEVIYAFGLVGWVLFLLLILFTMRYIYNTDRISFIIVLSTFVYSSVNSARGIAFTIIIFIYIMYFIKNIKIKRNLKYEKNIITSTCR